VIRAARAAVHRSRVLRWLALCGALLAPGAASHAGVLRYCDAPAELSAAQQDRLLRFGAVIKAALDASGHSLALIARSGLDLSRFGMRYSHAGVSLQASANAPWSVRQLYYDCDERRPRIFDQGIAGFLLGTGDPAIGYVSVLLMPAADAAPLERAVQDKRQALRLLGSAYSANAYPFALRYQNCNQWVAEMLAVAWGGLGEGGAMGEGGDDGSALRAEAQRWLQAQGYAPSRFEVGNPLLMWLGGALPWLHRDDHPPQDLEQQIFRVSMPAAIEAFVQARVPGARRIEFCHNDEHVVIRRGGEPIAEGCRPQPQDTVIALR
jgi:hypothetical protein